MVATSGANFARKIALNQGFEPIRQDLHLATRPTSRITGTIWNFFPTRGIDNAGYHAHLTDLHRKTVEMVSTSGRICSGPERKTPIFKNSALRWIHW